MEKLRIDVCVCVFVCLQEREIMKVKRKPFWEVDTDNMITRGTDNVPLLPDATTNRNDYVSVIHNSSFIDVCMCLSWLKNSRLLAGW